MKGKAIKKKLVTTPSAPVLPQEPDPILPALPKTELYASWAALLFLALVFLALGYLVFRMQQIEFAVAGFILCLALLTWKTKSWRVKLYRRLGRNAGLAYIVGPGIEDCRIFSLDEQWVTGVGGTYQVNRARIKSIEGIPTIIFPYRNPDAIDLDRPALAGDSKDVDEGLFAHNLAANLRAMSSFQTLFMLIIAGCVLAALLGGAAAWTSHTSEATCAAQGNYCQFVANETLRIMNHTVCLGRG